MGPRVVARKHQRAAVRSPALCPRAESGQLFYRSTICISRVFLVCFQVARRGSDSPKIPAEWLRLSRSSVVLASADDGAADADARHCFRSSHCRPRKQAQATASTHRPALSLSSRCCSLTRWWLNKGSGEARFGLDCEDDNRRQWIRLPRWGWASILHSLGAAPWTAAWCSFSSMRIKGRRSWSAATRSTGDGCSIRKPRVGTHTHLAAAEAASAGCSAGMQCPSHCHLN